MKWRCLLRHRDYLLDKGTHFRRRRSFIIALQARHIDATIRKRIYVWHTHSKVDGVAETPTLCRRTVFMICGDLAQYKMCGV